MINLNKFPILTILGLILLAINNVKAVAQEDHSSTEIQSTESTSTEPSTYTTETEETSETVSTSSSTNFPWTGPGIGDQCIPPKPGEQDECKEEVDGPVECKSGDNSGICQCTIDFTGIIGEYKCLPIRTEENQLCEISEQCSNIDGLGQYSICNEGKCECFDVKNPENPRKTRFNKNNGKCVIDNGANGLGGGPVVIIFATVFISKLYS